MIFGSRGYLGQQFRALYPNAECPAVDVSDRPAVAAIESPSRNSRIALSPSLWQC